jgi:hypothetical protein
LQENFVTNTYFLEHELLFSTEGIQKMSKAGVALAILGIIIGASGFWFGYTAWSNQVDIQARLLGAEEQLNSQSPQRLWYSSSEDIFTPTALVYEIVPNMNISIDLDTPVSLHLTFTSAARILPDPASFSDILFYFVVDGVRLTSPFTRVGSYQGQAAYEYHSVSMTHVIDGASPGHHDFAISLISERAGNFIRESTFTIVSFAIV